MSRRKFSIKLFLLIFILHTSYFILHTSLAFAQSDIANTYDLSDQKTQDGDILIFKPETGITKAILPYDVNIFGIRVDTPLAVFRRVDKSGNSIVRSGVAQVNVTTINGPIKAGDRITSSQIPGFGMKADISGYVIGTAINSFAETDGQDFVFQNKNLRAGRIAIAVKIEYAELTTPRSLNNLFSFLGTSLLQGIADPRGLGQAIKYIFAGLIVLVAITFGLVILLRSVPKSIEAIGRNPLARRSINISIAMNILIVIAITLAALFAAFLILRL